MSIIFSKTVHLFPVFLKEPIEKRWYLAKFFTSLVSITFFAKREQGDKTADGYTILFNISNTL